MSDQPTIDPIGSSSLHLDSTSSVSERAKPGPRADAGSRNDQKLKSDQKLKVAVVFGGRSAEHEVSINSARNVCSALDRKKFDVILIGISIEGSWYQVRQEQISTGIKRISDVSLPSHFSPMTWIQQKAKPWIFRLDDQQLIAVDIAMPILHGSFGEDGCIQGFFETLDLPYTGSNVLGNAVGMHKGTMKVLLQTAGIPVAPFILMDRHSPKKFEEVASSLGLPFFLKAIAQGSSVGVHKVTNLEDWNKAVEDAFMYDDEIIIEKAIIGREIECSVLGNGNQVRASLPGEVIPHHDFYSYEAKYLDDNGASFKIPAPLSEVEISAVRDLAIQSFKVLKASGFSRVDFFLTSEGKLLINEINTLPGFTKISMYPKMWEASGVTYSDLVTEIIHLGMKQYQDSRKLRRSLPTE